ncbi:hypothetical protein BD324DRAFT_651821 [Kockovaella imperatae]|uniref:Uncharacterized protein n=1 Tax=Kockovaella imperatae TaxID=4999 RepID=A0A1Y1UEE8_9TREE|nr:hypothetical protein BD324DRAFT_651821 [Kockovaella imperatae]ORX35907.1 hypothetical protein BD324DRAFT_651821 [Kockovaella imperatae]
MSSEPAGPAVPSKTHQPHRVHRVSFQPSPGVASMDQPLSSSSAPPNLVQSASVMNPSHPEPRSHDHNHDHDHTKASTKWRLLALKSKPTLSRTWEKRSFVEEQMSAPLSLSQQPVNGPFQGRQEMQMPSSSRPTSLYASPSALAAFRTLPPHSAPSTPTNATSHV